MTPFGRFFRKFFTLFKPNRNQDRDLDSDVISMHSFPSMLPQTALTPRPPSISTTSKTLDHDISIRDALITDETLPILKTTLDIHIVENAQSKMDAEYKNSDALQPLYSPEVRRPVEEIIEDNPDRQSLHSDTSTALPPYMEDERNSYYIFTSNSNPRAVGNVTNVDRLVIVDRRPGHPGPVIATYTPDDNSTYYYNQRRNAWHPRRQPAPPKTTHLSDNQNMNRLPRLYT